jgi:hypothetical protein
MARTQLGSWLLAIQGAFLECLEASIACPENGRNVCLLGMGGTKGVLKVAESFLKN